MVADDLMMQGANGIGLHSIELVIMEYSISYTR